MSRGHCVCKQKSKTEQKQKKKNKNKRNICASQKNAKMYNRKVTVAAIVFGTDQNTRKWSKRDGETRGRIDNHDDSFIENDYCWGRGGDGCQPPEGTRQIKEVTVYRDFQSSQPQSKHPINHFLRAVFIQCTWALYNYPSFVVLLTSPIRLCFSFVPIPQNSLSLYLSCFP